MEMETLQQLFMDELKDIYSAENQITMPAELVRTSQATKPW